MIASVHANVDVRHRRSPFGATVPSIVVAAAFALAALLWVVAGERLPGGRWLATHMFTLGVLTNLVLAFADHFGHTLTRAPSTSARWQLPAVNAGIVTMLLGLPTGTRWATAVGAITVMTVVLASYVRLRRMRKQAIGARFAWVVRAHERAHGAFVHGGVLGLLMGVGVLEGGWYGSARLAHLHVNLLGWGGLTLLATLVFFGPTMARTRILPGADERAAGAIRHGATGLTVGVLALLATGAGGSMAAPMRALAGAALGVFAWTVTVVCLPVARAAHGARRRTARWPVVALCSWFIVVAWTDALVVATGRWWMLDALGLALLLGVLGQAMTATLVYVAPMLRHRTAEHRARVRARLGRAAPVRTALWNVGVVAIAGGAAVRNAAGGLSARLGWMLVATVLLWILVGVAARAGDSRSTMTG